MGHQQKGKALKRKRSWHRRGAGPDRAWARAIQKLDRATSEGVMSRLDREQDEWWAHHGHAGLASGAEGTARAGVGDPGRQAATGDSDAEGTKRPPIEHGLLLAHEGVTDVGYLRMVLAAYEDADPVQLAGELRAL